MNRDVYCAVELIAIDLNPLFSLALFSFFFSGLIWSEIKQLWDVGLREYVNDMWNVIDFVTNSLYVATIALRMVAYYKVRRAQIVTFPLTYKPCCA